MNEELKVVISAEIGDLKKGLKEAKSEISSVEKETNKTSKEIQKSMEKVNKAVKTGMTVAVGAITAAVGAVAGFMGKVTESADRVDKLSQKMGISTDAFQEWEYACEICGLDVEVLKRAIKSLDEQMYAAADGSAEAQARFEALGVTWVDNEGQLKSNEELFKDTMLGLAAMSDETERNRIANELFGKSYQELIPLLNEGDEGLANLLQTAHDLGLVMSEEDIKAFAEFNDKITTIKESLGAMFEQVAADLLPIFQELADKVMEHLPEIQEKIEQIGEKVSDVIQWIVDNWSTISTIAAIIAGIAVAIQLVTTALGIYNSVMTVVNAVSLPMVGTIALIIAAIAALVVIIVLCVKHWDEIKEKVSEVWNKIKDWTQKAVEDVKNFFINLWESITNTVNNIKEGIVEKFTAIKEAITNKIKEAKEKVVNIFTEIKNFITEKVTAVRDTVNNIFTSIKDGITSRIEGARSAVVSKFEAIRTGIKEKIDAAREAVHSAIEKIKSFFNFNWSLPKLKMPHISITGSFSISPPSVPHFSISWYAKGGVFDKPTLFNFGDSIGGLGEDGAEAVVPLEKNTEWLDKIAERLNGNQKPIPIVLQVDGKTFAETSISSINQLTKQTGSLGLVLI